MKSFICLFVFGKEITLFPEAEWNKNQTILERNTQLFINRHIHTYQIEKMSDIKGSDFDTIVVGSDQIWRKQLEIKTYNPIYFGKNSVYLERF